MTTSTREEKKSIKSPSRVVMVEYSATFYNACCNILPNHHPEGPLWPPILVLWWPVQFLLLSYQKWWIFTYRDTIFFLVLLLLFCLIPILLWWLFISSSNNYRCFKLFHLLPWGSFFIKWSIKKEKWKRKERQKITVINKISLYTHICLFAEPGEKETLQFFYHNTWKKLYRSSISSLIELKSLWGDDYSLLKNVSIHLYAYCNKGSLY